MARFHGKKGKITIGESDQVGEVTDWSHDIDVPMADASFMGNDSRNVLPGQYGAQIQITCNYDHSDTEGQEALVTAMLTGASVTYKLYEAGDTTGYKYWTGSAFVAKSGEKGSVGAKITRDFSLTTDGDITRSSVSGS